MISVMKGKEEEIWRRRVKEREDES